MKRILVRTWMLAAAVAALAPANSLSASVTGEEDSGPTKSAACKVVGCGNGSQKCAEVHAEISDPLIGKLSVTWFCYETAAE